MFSFFTKNITVNAGGNKNIEDNQILIKEVFAAHKQKKNVSRAARESAQDQRKLVDQYNQTLEMTH